VMQWLMLLATIIIFCTATVLAGGYWSFVLWFWIGLGWTMLLGVHMFWRLLKWQLAMLIHADDAHLKDIALLHDARSSSSSASRWISERPRYLADDASSSVAHKLPQRLVGNPAPSKNPNQQKLLNIFLFGRNEVHFHIVIFRAIFLGCAIYTAVFSVNILGNFVSQVYDTTHTVVIAVLGLVPVAAMYSYLTELVQTAVMVTSVEHMRVRKVADQVTRYQKEHNAVWLMIIIGVMLQGDKHAALDAKDVLKVQQALSADEKAVREGTPMVAMVGVIIDMLGDSSDTELLMTRMMAIFDSVDDDGSGELELPEIHEIFKEIGFDSSQDITKFIQPMLDHMPQPKPKPTKKPPPPPSLCVPAPEPLKVEEVEEVEHVVVSKAVFLAWFLHLEKISRTLAPEEAAATWFEYIDDDQSGHISVVELQEVLQSTGKAFTADDVSALILELDANGDGEFDIEEFTDWFARHMTHNSS